jgi:ribosomal protein L11 methyltransferase
LKWLEISLTVNGELAEAVADIFARYVKDGVALIPDEFDTNQPQSFPVITVRAFLPVDDQIDVLRQRIEEGLWHLSQIEPLPDPSYRFLQQEDWADAWKEHYQPIPIGRRLLVLPAWISYEEKDRHKVILDPGMAFGTGTHPSTRLCLTALEDFLQDGDRVIDLGCGSGILSIAAARLGAENILAVDVDLQAVRISRENVHRNGLDGIIIVQEGSLSSLLECQNPSALPFDMLVANILAPTLETLVSEGLPQTVRPGGMLILSGVLDKQFDSFLEKCTSAGLELIESREEQDWRALILKTPI